MSCDVEKYRRRRLWEKDQSALCIEKGGVGFTNKGQPSRQVWVDWDPVPFPSFWSWIPQYRLLTDSASGPLIKLNYKGDPVEDGADISIASIGFTDVQVDMLGQEFTVSLNFTCTVVIVDFPSITVHRQTRIVPLFAPLVTDSYRFPNWGGFINDVNVAGVLPGCTVYPLSRCHQCSD